MKKINHTIHLCTDALAKLFWEVERSEHHLGCKKLILSFGRNNSKIPFLQITRSSYAPSANRVLLYMKGAWLITPEDAFSDFRKVRQRIKKTSWGGLHGIAQERGYNLKFDNLTKISRTTIDNMLASAITVQPIQQVEAA